MKHFLRLILFVYVAISHVAYVLACLAPFVHPHYSSLIYFSGLAFPFIAVNSSLIIIYFGLIRQKFTLLFLLVPILLFALNYVALNRPREISGDELLVYSFNAHSGTMFNERPDELNTWRNSMKEDANAPDILCLQEYQQDAATLFPGAEKLHVYSKEKSNLKIISKYTISDGGELKDSSGLRFAIYADIQLPNQKVRVYNFHLRSNHITKWLKAEEDNIRPRADRVITEGQKMKRLIYSSAKMRATEAQKLKWHIEASPYPVIVCGDMNETAQSYAYKQIKGKLKDSFQKGKPGYHATYLKNPSWVRIDYIFAGKEFDIQAYEVLPAKLSDHRMVKVWLKPEN